VQVSESTLVSDHNPNTSFLQLLVHAFP